MFPSPVGTRHVKTKYKALQGPEVKRPRNEPRERVKLTVEGPFYAVPRQETVDGDLVDDVKQEEGETGEA